MPALHAGKPGEGSGEGRGEKTPATRTTTNLGGRVELNVAHTSILNVNLGAAWMQTPLQEEATIGQNLVLDNPTAFGEMRTRRQHAGPQLSLQLNADTDGDFHVQPEFSVAFMPAIYSRVQTLQTDMISGFQTQLALNEQAVAAGRVSLGCAMHLRLTKRWALELLPRLQFSMMQGQRAGRLLTFRVAIQRR